MARSRMASGELSVSTSSILRFCVVRGVADAAIGMGAGVAGSGVAGAGRPAWVIIIRMLAAQRARSNRRRTALAFWLSRLGLHWDSVMA